MPLSKMNILNLIDDLSIYSTAIYNLIEDNKLTIEDITSLIFKNSIKEIKVLIPNFTSRISKKDIEFSINKYKSKFTKLDCLDIVIKDSEYKYHHLKEIRNVVIMDEMIDNIILDDAYNNMLNIYYFKLLFNKIKKSKVNNKSILKKYEEGINELFNNNINYIRSEIDSYYIGIITK